MFQKAISPSSKLLLRAFDEKLQLLEMETCTVCHEKWLDMEIKRKGRNEGVCGRCAKQGSKFSETDHMDPGMVASSMEMSIG